LNIKTNNSKETDKQNKPLDFDSIFRKKMLGQKRFDTVIKLDLQNNKIMVIDAEFCKSLPNVEVLDLRSNRLVEISPTIKAMMSIRVLKLDKNDLSILPEEVFDIIIMEELTFQ
jgi:Leucine-rich repeat (LRR) protein